MWEEVLQPACDTFGLAPVRADKISEAGEIPDQVFVYLRDADVVVADVSHANPNVMYELGLRHALLRVTLQIGEYEQLPFDLKSIRTLQFKRTDAGLIAVRNELIDALRIALTNGGPTALRASAIFNDPTGGGAGDVGADVARSVADEPDVEVEEPAMLEILAEGEAAVKGLGGVLGASGTALAEIGQLTADATVKMGEADARGQGFAGRLTVTKQLAEALRSPIQSFDTHADEFYRSVGQMDAMMSIILARLESGDEELDKAQGFLVSVLTLIDASDETAVKIAGFRDSVGGIRKMSAALGSTSRSLERSAGKYLEGIGILSGWRNRVERLCAA